MNKHSKIIIYDDTCPLCTAYTNAFVNMGLLEKEERKNFTTVHPDLLNMIDIKRSVNEIPLVDMDTKQVWYGIDALLEILGQKMPLIKTAGNLKPIKSLLYRLYNFISFNRRVIVATHSPEGSFDCSPRYNLRYRLLLMGVFLVLNTCLLFPFHQHILLESYTSNRSLLQLQIAHMLLVAVNIMIAVVLGKKTGIEYLGQVNMLATITLWLCIPLILLNKYLQLHDSTLNSFYLGMLVVPFLMEYTRRMKFAHIIPLHTWVTIVNGISIGLFLWYLFF